MGKVLKLRKMLKKNEKGFTLVELIVVIAILGVLAAIAIPRLTGVLDNAQDNADKATIKTIESAWSIYQTEKETGSANTWPEDYIGAERETTTDESPITIDEVTYTITDGKATKSE